MGGRTRSSVPELTRSPFRDRMTPQRAIGLSGIRSSEDGAAANVAFASLLASCQLHGIEPRSYVRDLLCLIPEWPVHRCSRPHPKRRFEIASLRRSAFLTGTRVTRARNGLETSSVYLVVSFVSFRTDGRQLQVFFPGGS